MENHHHCKICGNMISPEKTVCDNCLSAKGVIKKLTNPSVTESLLLSQIKSIMDNLNYAQWVKSWGNLKLFVSVCPESVRAKMQMKIDKIAKELSVTQKKGGELVYGKEAIAHIQCEVHLLLQETMVALYNEGYLEFGKGE